MRWVSVVETPIAMAGIDFALAHPGVQGLGHAADLGGNGPDGGST